MLIIDRYITRQVLLPTVVGLALLLLLFTAFTSVGLLRSAALGNLPARDVLALVVAHDLSALEVLLPSAFFAAVVMVMSTWHRDGEPYALYASGARPDRLSRPVWLLAGGVALCVLLLTVYGRPYSYQLRYDISERAANFTSANMESQRFYDWDRDFVIQAQQVRREEPNLVGVFAETRRTGQTLVVRAASAQISELDENRVQRIEFRDGTSYQIGNATNPDRITRFSRLIYYAQRPATDAQTKRRARTTGDLFSAEARKDIAELQWRFCLPLVALMLALIGIELARLKPKQSPYPRFAVAILLYVAVFNLANLSLSAVETGLLPRVPGMFSAVLLMLVVYLGLRRVPALTLKTPP
ncbi:MAG: LptF/LptG family permease [Pseudomonadales bacterium]